MRHVHSDRLERWLGADEVARVSLAMRDWYGPPIALQGVPGAVYAARGGDFVGKLNAGFEATKLDRAQDVLRKIRRGARIATSPKRAILHAGFASLSDLIAEASAGKRYEFLFNEVGPTGVIGVTSSLWGVGPTPPAAANASAAPGGNAPDDSTTGAFTFTNPSGGDTMHFVAGFPLASLQNTLLLYDRIFQVNKTMASTTNEAVTGVPTRYQSTTGGAADSAEGNFLFVEVGGTALAATAHNWDTCLYTDQAGNGSAALPTLTGVSGAIVRRLDHTILQQWFAPLATGDTGIQQLDQMHCSASVATGVINFVIGHPIAWLPCPIANVVCVTDGINTAFNLARIFDDAALTFLEVSKPAATATIYSGSFTAVAG